MTFVSLFLVSILLFCHITVYLCVSWQQTFASQLHLYTAREYFGQLMKNNYSCKNQKHEKAASKIHKQWGKLSELFENMVITSLLLFGLYMIRQMYLELIIISQYISCLDAANLKPSGGKLLKMKKKEI